MPVGKYERTEETRNKNRESILAALSSTTSDERAARKERARKTIEKRREDGVHYKNWVEPKERACISCGVSFVTKRDSKYCSQGCYHEYRKNNIADFKMSDAGRASISEQITIRHKENREVKLTDEDHQRLLREFKEYKRTVNKMTEATYSDHYHEINPECHPRTLCGVDGGYQLDHILSIRYGFDNGISVHEIAARENLQMLPWRENLLKGK